MQLFCDLDGVLADFDTHYENLFDEHPDREDDGVWDNIKKAKDFFIDIPPMKDLDILWNKIEPYYPIILTGIPKDNRDVAIENKKHWVKKYLGKDVPCICCRSSEKCEYAHPGDILIDDWEKYKKKWIKKGGIWITYINAQSTVDILDNMGL